MQAQFARTKGLAHITGGTIPVIKTRMLLKIFGCILNAFCQYNIGCYT